MKNTINVLFSITIFIATINVNATEKYLKIEKKWTEHFGTSRSDMAMSYTPTDDGGLLIVGGSLAKEGDIDITIFKIDYLGNLDWSKVIGESESEYASSVSLMRDGGFIIGLSHQGIYDKKKIRVSVLRTDCYGNELWRRNLKGERYNKDIFSIQQLSQGYWILGNEKTSKYAEPLNFKVKLDNSGNILSSKDSIKGEIKDVLRVDDGYAVLETHKSRINEDENSVFVEYSYFNFFKKYDRDAEFSWLQPFYCFDGVLLLTTLCKTNDGYVVSGKFDLNDIEYYLADDGKQLRKVKEAMGIHTKSSIVSSTDYNGEGVLLIGRRTTGNGAKNWMKLYNTKGYYYAYEDNWNFNFDDEYQDLKVVKGYRGVYYICGHYKKEGADRQDIFVRKLKFSMDTRLTYSEKQAIKMEKEAEQLRLAQKARKEEEARRMQQARNSSSSSSSGNSSYQKFCTIKFEFSLVCMQASEITVTPLDGSYVDDVSTNYNTVTIDGNYGNNGVAGSYKFVWRGVSDCGISEPSRSDYKTYSGTFPLDGKYTNYTVYISDGFGGVDISVSSY